MYAETKNNTDGENSGDAGGATGSEGEQGKAEDDVVDAEFEDIGKK